MRSARWSDPDRHVYFVLLKIQTTPGNGVLIEYKESASKKRGTAPRKHSEWSFSVLKDLPPLLVSFFINISIEKNILQINRPLKS